MPGCQRVMQSAPCCDWFCSVKLERKQISKLPRLSNCSFKLKNTVLTVVILILIDRDGESAKASKRSLTKLENHSSNKEAVTVVVTEKPSFLKLNKKGKATSTTIASCHTENESAL